MKSRNEALKQQIDQATGQAVSDKWIIRNDALVLVDKDGNPKRV